MSTTKKHIGKIQQLHYTHEQIDAQIEAEIGALTSTDPNPDLRLAVAGQAELLQTLTGIFAAVRPILAVIATLPLLRPAWREALRLFLTTLDQLVAIGPEGDFKAGKDL